MLDELLGLLLEELGLLLLDELGLLLLEPDPLLMPEELPELSELPDDELPAPETPSAESVCESRLPDALRPCCCWNCFTAARVFGPILPSAVTLMPFSLSACCASRTVEAAVLPDELEEPLLPLSIDDWLLLSIDEPLELLPIDEPLLLFPIEELLPIDGASFAEAAPLFEALGELEVDCEVPLLAKTAVLDRTSAARVNLRRSM